MSTRKAVVFAQLHDGFFIPGMGQSGGQFDKTLPPTKTLKNFKMYKEEDGTLTLNWEDGKYLQSISVGAANVKIAKFAPELIVSTPSGS